MSGHPFTGAPGTEPQVPICTRIAPDPRRPDYRVVELDRGRFASLPAEAVDALGLTRGASLGDDALGRLHELADVEAAWRAALRLEAQRSHSRMDLRRRLLMKQHPPRAVEAALDRLAALGLQDDARFAESFARARLRRGRGPGRIVSDLLAQGIERRAAEHAAALAVAGEGIDVAAEARRLASARDRQLAGLPAPERRRRLLAFLARRGFRGTLARELVQSLTRA